MSIDCCSNKSSRVKYSIVGLARVSPGLVSTTLLYNAIVMVVSNVM